MPSELPPNVTVPAAPSAPERRSVLAWAERKGTPAWLLRATAARCRWEIRAETDPSAVTEDEFDAAVALTRDGRC